MEPGTEFDLLSADLRAWGDPPYMVSFWYHVVGEHPPALSVYGWDGAQLTGEPLWTLAQEPLEGKLRLTSLLYHCGHCLKNRVKVHLN